MNKRIIKTTAEKVERLMEAIRSLPDQPVGNHLSEEECIAYAMGEAAAESAELMDKHLAYCSECATRMERLLEMSELWQAEPSDQRLISLQQRARSKAIEIARARLAAQLATVILFTGIGLRRARASTPVVEDNEVDNGAMGWRIEEDEDANLNIYIDSPIMELEGLKLRLEAGEWHDDLVLSRVAQNQVGGQTVIPRNERAKGDAVLRCSIVLEDANDNGSI